MDDLISDTLSTIAKARTTFFSKVPQSEANLYAGTRDKTWRTAQARGSAAQPRIQCRSGDRSSGKRHRMRTDAASALFEAIDPSDHLANDAPCQGGLDISADPQGGEIFEGLSDTDCALPAGFDRAIHEIVRTRQQGAGAIEDCYLITLQLSGYGGIAQDGVQLTVAPSEIAIIDGGRPFDIKVLDSGSRIILTIPRDLADRRAPWLRQRGAEKVMTS